MARTRRPRARRATVVRGEIVVPWEDLPAVRRATRAIARTFEKTAKANTEAVLTMARQIVTGRARLDDGEFTRWVREALPFGVRTAHNYLGLLAWSERAPALVAARAHLGPTKLYRLAPLKKAQLRRFRPGVPIDLPDGGKKTIEQMTVKELDHVIGDLAPPPLPPPKADKVLAAIRHRAAGLAALTDELVTLGDDVDDAIVGEVIAELRGITERLEDAFVG